MSRVRKLTSEKYINDLELLVLLRNFAGNLHSLSTVHYVTPTKHKTELKVKARGTESNYLKLFLHCQTKIFLVFR